MDEVIYFELNNWCAGRDYPAEEPFLQWMKDDLNISFRNDEWAKQNKICVIAFFFDMSQTFCVTASRSWVEKNCACLFDHEKFIRLPDKYGDIESKFGGYFQEYKPENYGVKWVEIDIDDE